MSDRGSGRTARQLAALPDGAYFLVHSQLMASHCERLVMAAGRQRSAVHFITCDASERSAMGLRPRAWDVDHAYFVCAPRGRARQAYDLLWMAAGKGPLSEQ